MMHNVTKLKWISNHCARMASQSPYLSAKVHSSIDVMDAAAVTALHQYGPFLVVI